MTSHLWQKTAIYMEGDNLFSAKKKKLFEEQDNIDRFSANRLTTKRYALQKNSDFVKLGS